MVEAVEVALADLRTGLQSDGADLQLEGVEEKGVRVRLVMDEATRCSECILPKPALIRVIQASLARHGMDDKMVELIDPRDE